MTIENHSQNIQADWTYDPAPQSIEHVHIHDSYELFINGKFTASKNGSYRDSINPATEKTLTKVAEAGIEDVDLAVEAARQAYEGPWSKMTAAERGKFLFRIARMIQERSRELAIVESLDGGKPIRESRDVDIPLAAAHFFYYAGWADKLDYAFPGRQAQPV